MRKVKVVGLALLVFSGCGTGNEEPVGRSEQAVTAQNCSFVFNRLTAAQTAWRLASHNPYRQTNATEYSVGFELATAPYSAYFMSLSNFAGGLPMLRNGTAG